MVLNCAGPWAPQLLRTLAPELAIGLPDTFSVAMNLVTRRSLVTSHGVAGQAGTRQLFMLPWREFTIVGTSHDAFRGHAGERCSTPELVERFLVEVNQAFPGAKLAPSELSMVHRGLLPAVADGSGTSHGALRKTSAVQDHRGDGLPGLVSVLGVRYTTARDTAQTAVDSVFRLLDKAPPACQTATTPLVGGDIEDTCRFVERALEAAGPGVTQHTATRLARSYGTTYPALLRRLEATQGDARELGPGCSVTAAEIRHAVQEEMAVRLSDAVLRRTEAGSGGLPGDDALLAAAEVMTEELGWSPERLDQEITDVKQAFDLVP